LRSSFSDHRSLFTDHIFSQRRQIELRRAADGPLRFAGDSHLTRGVEVNLVLQDFLDDDFHLVVALEIHQRPGAGVDRGQPLLNQRRQLKPAADFVDDLFFFQRVDHCKAV
jgi:hypothetical protein